MKARFIPTGVYHVRHVCGTAHALCGHTFGNTPPILLTQAEEQQNQLCVVCEELQEQPCMICGGTVWRQ